MTPDGRYLVIQGKSGPRLWRTDNPNLREAERDRLVSDLMAARRAVKGNKTDPEALQAARAAVHIAKCDLGERGQVWWSDGSPDFNRRLIKNTPYRLWWEAAAKPGRKGQ